ncbi:endonuclease/exonuclease/phosphatase family protein [Acetobacter sacchari]|uniref:Endonuclease/exonuclease/phosphatase family protein n=1 Tax=Acetobacter sacchari TaxID=2661687 RepID=A0ABS3LRU4_9PROT|nr:endonuclease/exonuclease/phosphatase family protein [Acetobacter sacchari]
MGGLRFNRNRSRSFASGAQGGAAVTIISWNLLHSVGATLGDVVALIERERPDLLLMQEATADIDLLPERIGGYYARAPLPGRIHGPACWSRRPFARAPRACAIPSGALVRRVAQVIALGDFTVANVHLSHGQIMNRRQLRRLAAILPAPAAILGDFNLVGPALVPGFQDVGPREPTHRMADLLPIRIDRCLVRGMNCEGATVLPVYASDHQPIMVRVSPAIVRAAG